MDLVHKLLLSAKKIRVAEINKYPNIAPDFGSDARRFDREYQAY
jgi:hypothetical protein